MLARGKADCSAYKQVVVLVVMTDDGKVVAKVERSVSCGADLKEHYLVE